MNNLLNISCISCTTAWIIGVFALSIGGLIHILLIVAGIIWVLNQINNGKEIILKNPKQTNKHKLDHH